MKHKIIQELIDWYEQQETKEDMYIEDFVEKVIDRTAEVIFEEVKNELKNEFSTGSLKHNFVISSDYYLDLKLKEIRDKCVKPKENLDDTF